LSELPESLSNLTQLQVLFVANNQLLKLPASIGDLSKLCYLNIQYNRLDHIPLVLYRLKQLADTRNLCLNGSTGLWVDTYLLDDLPAEIVEGGTSSILDYLENQAMWHMRGIVASVASGLGLLVVGILTLRWQYYRRRRKSKRSGIIHGQN